MKVRYTRAELTIDADGDRDICILCRSYDQDGTGTTHAEDCPFADETVTAVTVALSPERPHAVICLSCRVGAQECPGYIYGGGWALCTHKRLMEICERYREKVI